MTRLLRLLLACLALAALPAKATFHLWTMNELFSSADGTVQFLELTALTGGQQFLANHTLVARNGSGTTHTFTFTNLSGDSAGRRMLVGTQSFAALNVVAPDFIVPDNFFFRGGGTIEFGEGADTWSHGALPTDGVTSLNRDNSTGTNSPRNYAGATGTINAAPRAFTAFNVHGLWQNDPDGSEDGWGVNFSQHGNIVFLTWFTYDLDGTPMWLVMSNGNLTADNTFEGELFRTTGAPFNNYDRSRFVPTSVGTARVTFTDANNGQFTYRVGSIQQSKQIRRYRFGALPTCDQSGAAATNVTDLYLTPGEDGWGVNLVQQGNLVFLTWFTYDQNNSGRGMWYVGSGLVRTTGNTFTGPIYRTTSSPFNAYNKAQFQIVQVGTATVSFSNASNATFTYTVDNVPQQTKNITRFVHALPATTCR